MAALPENALSAGITDADPQETQEWQDALSGVIDREGAERASSFNPVTCFNPSNRFFART